MTKKQAVRRLRELATAMEGALFDDEGAMEWVVEIREIADALERS